MLDASSTALWELRSAGVDDGVVARALAHRFGLTIEDARSYLNQLNESWCDAGLLEPKTSTMRALDEPFEPIPTFPAPDVCQAPPGAWWLTVAQRRIVVQVHDIDLRTVFGPLFASLLDRDPPSSSRPVNRVILSGDAQFWRLTINGAEADSGHGCDAALVSTLAALTELGCRTQERLLVVHGAGLVTPDDRCFLMAAPGGSGKSTLAAALEADGFQLLSDDVVPIRSDGAALGLGLPSCVKRGSWPVLAHCRPDLEQAIEVLRFGQTVRFLSPRHRPMTGAVTPSLLLFPRYRPDTAPSCTPLPPEQALQRLIEAEAVIRDLTQHKLETLCGWISAIPAYALTYQNLAMGMSLVRGVLDDHPTSSRR